MPVFRGLKVTISSSVLSDEMFFVAPRQFRRWTSVLYGSGVNSILTGGAPLLGPAPLLGSHA